jgi:hypothetical protein
MAVQKSDKELIEDISLHTKNGWSLELSAKKSGITYGSLRRRAQKNEVLRQLMLKLRTDQTSIYDKALKRKAYSP